ncbi:MAG: FeoB-associated Cys-rich membrane protein [Ruminococcus sp.]|nr:FeoB-associated Cys-rich membrane protein [Ruminococcus sp.]
MSFIIENIGTIIIGLIVFVLIAGIVIKLVKDKRKGKTSCGCGCSNCPSSGICHKK